MSPRIPRVASAATYVVLFLGLTACGGDAEPSSGTASGGEFDTVADQSTCLADAAAVAEPWPDGFPSDWPFPEQTTAYNVEDRGSDGVIVTAASTADFADILDFMNNDVVDTGYAIESGETEEHDAEAEWEGNGFRGRWAIRESAQCPGETVIQVLSAPE